MTCEFPRWEVTGQRNRAQRRFEALSPSPQPSPSGRESSGLCARIAPRNLTRALLAGLDHKRMPALISNDLRVSKMGGYWAENPPDFVRALRPVTSRELFWPAWTTKGCLP